MSDRSYMTDTDGGNGGITMAGFLMGAIVGAGLALLLAPAPGGETRQKLGETARRIGRRASDMVGRGSEGESGTDEFGAERNAGGQAGEPFRSGGRREPMAGRTPQTGTPGTSA